MTSHPLQELIYSTVLCTVGVRVSPPEVSEGAREREKQRERERCRVNTVNGCARDALGRSVTYGTTTSKNVANILLERKWASSTRKQR